MNEKILNQIIDKIKDFLQNDCSEEKSIMDIITRINEILQEYAN